MRSALINARILLGSELHERLALVIENGLIASIVAQDDPEIVGLQCYDCQGNILLPGFIDVQVNGGGGVLFNDDPSVSGIKAIAAAHRKFGTTGLLPTLISDDLDVIKRAIEATEGALQDSVPGILGVHIEGPFISAERKGTHNQDKFRVLGQCDVALLSSLKHGKTLVTLAPERNSLDMIRGLVNNGVIVSAGHTNASFAECRLALDAGLTGFTHLFNAMSPLTNREPGAVGAALFDQDSWCGIIVDGFHVDPVTLRIALRCKPMDKFLLVTDAMPNLGTDAAKFQLQGKTVHVRGGRCVDDNGVLSGSALDMASAVRNAQRLLGVSLPQAASMASTYPAEFLGLGHQLGKIAPGYQADLVLVDEAINVIDTWIHGRPATENLQLR
jgi:N-acetylglucosamine-6-phosphate deacetylase